jgi:hypothetical protein
MAGTLVMAPAASGAATITSLIATNHIVTVNWTLPADEEVYRVDLASSPGFPEDGGQSEFPGVTSESVTFEFPVPGGTWYARVVTCPAPAEAGCPQIDSNIVDVPVPSGAATVQSAGVSGGVFTAAWALPANVAPLWIEVSPLPDTGPFGFLVTAFDGELLPGETNYVAPTSLPPGAYYVHVQTLIRPDLCTNVVGSCVTEWSNVLGFRVGFALPSGGGGPSGTTATGSADKTVALGAVTAASRQDVDKLAITVNLGEAAKVKLSGSVNVPGASKVYRFKTLNRSVKAGKTKLPLKLASKAKRAIKKALRRKKNLKAKLTLAVTDNAGNAQTKKYSVRLRP